MEPVLMGPAEHELDDATTKNVFDAALSVVLKVTPVIIIYILEANIKSLKESPLIACVNILTSA